jgi:hypothetical protein
MAMDIAELLDLPSVGSPDRLEGAQPHPADRATVFAAEIARQLDDALDRLLGALEPDVGKAVSDIREHRSVPHVLQTGCGPAAILDGSIANSYKLTKS